jgi:hypothetical protein
MSKTKILFIASTYLDLYKEIVYELEKQQYDVCVIPNVVIRFDPRFGKCQNLFIRIYSRIYSRIFASRRKYWENMVRRSEFNQKYDIFFCLNGHSIDEILINHLKKINRNIKTVLYLWDSDSHYKFSKTFTFFDEIFTFDRHDAIRFNITHLPIFWINNETIEVSNEYQISFIGSYRPERYRLIKNIIKQIEQMNLLYYIKLFVPVKHPSIYFKTKYLLYRMLFMNEKIEEWKVEHNRFTPSFVINHPILVQQFNDIMKRSLCILDTDIPSQNGLTARLIWALAANKKIITTNKDIVNYPFYSPDRVLIIDRKNPHIQYDFITYSIDDANLLNGLIELRIDNWIKTILGHYQ